MTMTSSLFRQALPVLIALLVFSACFSQPGTAAIQNPDFETGDLSGWTAFCEESASTFSVIDSDAASGTYHVRIQMADVDRARLSQSLTGLDNGIYSLSARVQNSGGQTCCYLRVSGYGGPEQRAALPTAAAWKQILIRGIEITNGRLDLAFHSEGAAGHWSALDQFELVRDGVPYTLLIGGDITVLSMIEDAGGRFHENGIEKDCLEILKNKGWNIVRIRLYNDPGNPAYTPSNRLPAGYQNPAAALALAQRAKEKGFQIQLSFHYSDYWTNPGRQDKPHEWEGYSFVPLRGALYDFTYSFLQQMAAQGTAPEFVSIGNEIPGGLLYPDGSTSNWPQLAELLTAGYEAVKAASPTSQVILHLDDACDYDKYNWFFGNCGTYGIPYDIIGASYYPYWTQSTIVELKTFLDVISQTFDKPILLMETGYNWNPVRSDGYVGQLQNNGPMPYPSSPEGQRDFMLELFSAIPTVQGGRCIGDLYWDPVMIAVPGVGWELGAANVVDNTTLFDFEGHALPVLDAYLHNGVYLPPAPDPSSPAPPVPTALYGFEGTWDDDSGNGYDGTNAGAVFVAGKVGAQAAGFNGTSASVSIPASVASDFTVAMWVKTSDTGGYGSPWTSGKGLVDGSISGTGADWGTAVLGGKFALGIGNPDTTIASSAGINDNTWHHVAATRHSATGAMAVYVDGLLSGSGAGPVGARTPSTLRIGSLRTGTGFLNGAIDEVRLYSRVLSAAEIAALPGPPPAPSGLTATAGDMKILLEWEGSGRASSYLVKRASDSGGPYTTVASVARTTHYTDGGLSNGTTYYYVVSAVNAAGESSHCPEAAATPLTDDTPPSPNPMRWAAAPEAYDSGSVTMTAETATDISGVEYSFVCTSGGGHDSGWQASPVYLDTGLQPNVRYTYTVAARDQSSNRNQTAPSIPASVITSMAGVVNHSFEADGISSEITPAGWTWNGSGGRGLSAGGTDGSYFFWQGNGSTLRQPTGQVIGAEGEVYTLRADVRNSWQGSPKAALYYEQTGDRIELASASLPANGDSWPAFETLEVTAVTTADSVGRNLGVELTLANYPGNAWSEFDNIRLSASNDASWLYGDFTGDHVVDLEDLTVFLVHWLREDCQSLSDFDEDGDCRIGLFEFSRMAGNWLTTD